MNEPKPPKPIAGDRDKTLHPMEVSHLQARRERVFLVLAGLFLGSLTMLNILGISSGNVTEEAIRDPPTRRDSANR